MLRSPDTPSYQTKHTTRRPSSLDHQLELIFSAASHGLGTGHPPLHWVAGTMVSLFPEGLCLEPSFLYLGAEERSVLLSHAPLCSCCPLPLGLPTDTFSKLRLPHRLLQQFQTYSSVGILWLLKGSIQDTWWAIPGAEAQAVW